MGCAADDSGLPLTMLVGVNGTGKSTAADALRTLLVPPARATYNDASIASN